MGRHIFWHAGEFFRSQRFLCVVMACLVSVPVWGASVYDVDDSRVPAGELALYEIVNALRGTEFTSTQQMAYDPEYPDNLPREVREAEVCWLLSGYKMEVRARALFSDMTQECGYYWPVSLTELTMDLRQTTVADDPSYEDQIFYDWWYEENQYPAELIWLSENDASFPPKPLPFSMGFYGRAPATDGALWPTEASLVDGDDRVLVFLVERKTDPETFVYLMAFEDPPQGGKVKDEDFNDWVLEIVVTTTGQKSGGYGSFDPFSAAHAGADQSKPVGQQVSLDGSNSHGDTTGYEWDFDTLAGGSTLQQSDITTYTDESPVFTTDAPGVFTLSLVVDDGVVVSEEDLVNITATTTTPAYVDFAYVGTETGSASQPFNTVGEGVLGVTAAGEIWIDGSSTVTATTETFTGANAIDKNVTIKAYPAGTKGVRIGAAWPSKSGPVPGTATDTPSAQSAAGAVAEERGRVSFWLRPFETLLKELRKALGSDVDGEVTAEDRRVYEPVLPFATAGDALDATPADAALAIRLRSKADIDPDSIWSPSPTADATVEWQPAKADGLRDLWVIVRPRDIWRFQDRITVAAGATTLSGETVGPATYEFLIEAADAYEARAATPPKGIWQPEYHVDFAPDTLDLDAESNEEATLTRTDDTVAADALPKGLDESMTIGPEEVYGEPQRIWLPIPPGLDAGDVQLYYYHANGPDRGWYRAESVDGWLVPNSYRSLEVDGTAYLGFAVRHGGIVQLAIPEGPNE